MVRLGLQLGLDNHRWVQGNADRIEKNELTRSTDRLCRQSYKNVRRQRQVLT